MTNHFLQIVRRKKLFAFAFSALSSVGKTKQSSHDIVVPVQPMLMIIITRVPRHVVSRMNILD